MSSSDKSAYPPSSFPDPRTPDAPFVVGVQGSQLGSIPEVKVFGQTVNAVPQVIDTHIPPPNGHGNTFNGTYNVTDRTAQLVAGGNGFGTERTYGGVAVLVAQTWTDETGDAALATALPSLSISGTQTIVVTFTPPAGYVGTLDWFLFITILRN